MQITYSTLLKRSSIIQIYNFLDLVLHYLFYIFNLYFLIIKFIFKMVHL